MDKDTELSINEEYLKVIKKRAKNLINRIPKLEEPINRYIKNQEVECDILDKNITGAIWLLQRKK